MGIIMIPIINMVLGSDTMIKSEIFNLAEKDLNYSIYCKNLTTGEVLISLRENKAHRSASVIKVLIMAEALRQTEEGNYSLYQMIKVKDNDVVPFSVIEDLDIREFTYKDLISLMIAYSDNTATNVLIDLLGLDKINELANLLHLQETKLTRKMMDFEEINKGNDNYTSIHDTFMIFNSLLKREIVCEKLSELAFDILKKQKHRDAFLRFINDDEFVLAHKTGQLDCINHDVGIFYLKNVQYFLGVFVSNGTSNAKNKEFIGKVSEIIYNTFKDS